MPPDQREAVEHTLRRAAELDGAVHRNCPVGAIRHRRLIWPMREALHLAPASARQHAPQALLATVHDQAAVTRHCAHQMMELRLDRGQVGKDVGMVVFEIVQDRRARTVVHEFRALVEERGVVFVGLDHEERAVGQPRRYAEVDGTPPIRKPGCEAGVLEDPREHRRRGGLAVRPGHREHPLARQHVLASHCGPEV